MESLSERIKSAVEAKEARDHRAISPADIARAIKVTEAAVSNWLNEKNGIGPKKARDLAGYLAVDALWLELGDNGRTKSAGLVLVESAPTPADIAELVTLFLESESGTRGVVLNMLRADSIAKALKATVN